MNSKYIKHFSFLLFACLIFLSCNKESYIEGLGTTSVVGTDPVNNTGSFTIFSRTGGVGLCSSGINVFVNGEHKGTITDYDVSQKDPACGAKNNKALTIKLAVGTYEITASGTGVLCPKYKFSVTVKKGVCTLVPLQ